MEWEKGKYWYRFIESITFRGYHTQRDWAAWVTATESLVFVV